MTKSVHLGDGGNLDPLRWARLALSSRSLHEARDEIKKQLEDLIHVNSLLISFGRWVPDPSHGRKVSSIAFRESAGVLVNREWTEFLNAGNFLDDPMVKRLKATHRSLFWWENSPVHRSMNEDECLFARHYFEHDIRLGIVDGVIDYRRHALEIMALDSRSSLREFEDFKRLHGGQLQLAIAWLFEGIRLKSLVRSSPCWDLAPRERECLAWTSTGMDSGQISERLNISSSTVDEYVASAMRRLGAETRVQACARATLLELIVP